MPCSPEAIKLIQGSGLLFALGKAANAGGVTVATSGSVPTPRIPANPTPLFCGPWAPYSRS
eukprot:3229676-Rhodomonas_salina.1